MNQQQLHKMWNEQWGENTWFAAWSKALGDLTPAQAAWRPAPGKHSIWQVVNHVSFWREYTLRKVDGRPGPGREDIDRENFVSPSSPDAEAWKLTIERLHATHQEIGKLIAAPGAPMDRLPYHLTHDAYHLGQIMYLRALQGLPPIE